jgi:GNAT superfamily N-acetyltransferase
VGNYLDTYWSTVESEVIMHNRDESPCSWVALIPRPSYVYFQPMGFSVEKVATNGAYFIRKRVFQIAEVLNESPGEYMVQQMNIDQTEKDEQENNEKKQKMEQEIIERVRKELEKFTMSSYEWSHKLESRFMRDRIHYGIPGGLNEEEFREQLEEICGDVIDDDDETPTRKFGRIMRKLLAGDRHVICFAYPTGNQNKAIVEAFCIYKLRYNRKARTTHLYVDFLCTRERAQGQAYGRRLLESCQSIALLYKESAFAAVISLNATLSAHPFYLRLGFKVYRELTRPINNRPIGYLMKSDNLYKTPLKWKSKTDTDDDDD